MRQSNLVRKRRIIFYSSGGSRLGKKFSRLSSYATVLLLLLILALFVFPSGAIADSWTKENTNGFGDVDNGSAASMCIFGSNLYVGTTNGNGCEIWRSPDGTNWTKVSAFGFGDVNNIGAFSMCEFDAYLYVGTYNKAGCEIWRSANGTDWSQVNTNGFGDTSNKSALCLCAFNSNLYVGTQNENDNCEVWRSPNGIDWSPSNTDGFGASFCSRAASMCKFGSYLYVGTGDDCRIVRSSNGTDWVEVSGAGFNDKNMEVTSMCKFDSDLYVGTDGLSDGCNIYRSSNGTDWTLGSTGGFGDVGNFAASCMCVLGSDLYVGCNYDEFTKGGCEVWRSSNGTDWSQANTDGFNSQNNSGALSMSVFDSGLYVGTCNLDGCEVWRTDGPSLGLTSTYYLAEGSTAWGFNTYITIENPNSERLTARITYMDPNRISVSGVIKVREVFLPPESQTTIDPRWDFDNVDFSTKVECLEGATIAVDRTMFWTGEGAASPEGHNSVGASSLSKVWYLPEGSSAWGFETCTLIQNPNNGEADITLTYMTEDAGQKVIQKKVPGNSRATNSMLEDIGIADSSIKVTSDIPVIAERSMYKNNRREGSCSIGAAEPSTEFYLAEGSTAWGFTTYVLVQNPNDSETEVTLTYNTPEGPVEQPPFTMPANSRKTVRVNDVLPNTDCSVKVSSNKPIVAERSMYWNSETGEAMHSSIGVSLPHMTFYLPDGQTSDGFETYTLVQNSGSETVTVEITYLPQDGGETVTFTDEIPAGSRKTYNMADEIPSGRASIMVKSVDGGTPIICERAMYWNNRGAGTDTVGGFNY